MSRHVGILNVGKALVGVGDGLGVGLTESFGTEVGFLEGSIVVGMTLGCFEGFFVGIFEFGD